MRRYLPSFRLLPLLSISLLAACGSDDGGDHSHDAGTDVTTDTAADAGNVDVPETYAFESRFVEGASSVAYDGQVFRQVLIEALKGYVGRLTTLVDDGTLTPVADGDLVATLDYWFRFDGELAGGEALPISASLPLLQQVFDDVSSGKDLVGKVAGNDASTDYIDFTTGFRGWDNDSLLAHGGNDTSAEGLIVAMFETLEENAIQRALGEDRLGPGDLNLPVHLTADGIDLQQLMQKLLTVSITFHQGLDDYLDDDVDGKGILADNTEPAGEGVTWTALEHQWDEGFGYFGATVDYGFYTVDEIAAAGGRDDWQGYHDSNGDGSIDLLSEYIFGLASNAGKRDRAANAPTTMAHDAFDAFVAGRALIASADGALSEAQLAELRGYRDTIAYNWELAIAATVIHYINGTLAIMEAYENDAASYDFATHAKKWSEMKGFALGFQFNPDSPVLSQFDQLHTLLRSAPALPGGDAADWAQYRADLVAARGILADAFDVDPANVGDENGANGW